MPTPGPGLMGRLLAAAYDRCGAGMEHRIYGAQRRRLLRAARGRVLEVGAGTGANLPHYPWPQITELVLVDPSPGMLDRARRKAAELGRPVELVERAAEQLPFHDASFDTVVSTFSLCTIPDPAAALGEAHRVLRPSGRLLVLEHVRASNPGLAAWQDRLTTLWQTVNLGCHPNRDTRRSIEGAGFAFESLEEARERRIPIAIVQPQLTGTARRAD
jgi:ubiquinone/menaquinone biosynthesis C-methylase UbiE